MVRIVYGTVVRGPLGHKHMYTFFFLRAGLYYLKVSLERRLHDITSSILTRPETGRIRVGLTG